MNPVYSMNQKYRVHITQTPVLGHGPVTQLELVEGRSYDTYQVQPNSLSTIRRYRIQPTPSNIP